jgi:hypothetical protein
MKRLALPLTLLLILGATAVFAGDGKSCNTHKTAAKSVELTGTIAQVGSGDEARTVFRVANSDQRYTVCEKTKASVLRQAAEAGATYRVSGKLVSCGDGQELVIENAKKV